MQEQGFEYVPQVPALEDLAVGAGPDPASREFAEQYGYGVWAAPEAWGPDSIQWTVDADPEQRAYLDAMTETTRAAYDEAMGGPVVGEVGPDGSVTREGGCLDRVHEFSTDPALASVAEEAWAYLAELDDSPRFTDIDREWSRCMRDAGFDATSPASARREIGDAMMAAGTSGTMPDDVDERASAEQALALADWDCQESTGYRDAHRSIAHELQQDYVDDHQADLDAWLEATTTPVSEGEQ